MHTCTMHIFKNISHEPMGYNTKVGIDGVQSNLLDISK